MEFMMSSQSRPEFQQWLSDAIDEIFVKDKQASSFMRVFHQSRGTDFFARDMDVQIYDLLPNILMGSIPPSHEELLDTPSVDDIGDEQLKKNMLVYVVIMMRDPRYAEGDENVSSEYPARYELVHVGALMMMPLDLVEIYVRRGGFLIFETTLSWKLWTIYQPEDQALWIRDQRKMRDVCRWPLDELDYQGLNTHSPLKEGNDTLLMTIDEVVEAAKLARERHLENGRIRSKKSHDKNWARKMEMPEFREHHRHLTSEFSRRDKEALQGLRPERLEMAQARHAKLKVAWLKHHYKVKKPKRGEKRKREAEEAERRIRPYIDIVTAEDLEKERVRTRRNLNTRSNRYSLKTKASEDSDKENEDPEADADEEEE
ncbi:hypothetical protein LTR70_001059 [Exophiala xenobiotica]|uniref:Uncharacterized protein n=1 Tax=Lithohypha guttulata TaxID=1690604 RepID=A0ABR0KMV0_9EURO|nr:hypothetical protein LTR24_000752 [Lithohypha guttulata]KAK5328905.1 hypothetical protein LTR70_001059 [Exophiala xenobiotica]